MIVCIRSKATADPKGGFGSGCYNTVAAEGLGLV